METNKDEIVAMIQARKRHRIKSWFSAKKNECEEAWKLSRQVRFIRHMYICLYGILKFFPTQKIRRQFLHGLAQTRLFLLEGAQDSSSALKSFDEFSCVWTELLLRSLASGDRCFSSSRVHVPMEENVLILRSVEQLCSALAEIDRAHLGDLFSEAIVLLLAQQSKEFELNFCE